MSVIEQKIILKAVDEASRNIKAVSDSAKKGSEEVIRANEKTKLSYDNLKSAIGLTAGAFTAVSAVAVLAGKSLVETEIQVNRIEKALKIYTGSMSGASSEIAFLKDQSKRLGLEFSSTALAYSQLAVASKGTAITSSEVKDIFVATSEAGSALGLSAYDVEGALRAMQQMMSKGTVQAEELRGQLGERIPGAFTMASKAMGVTERELGKMLERGEVMASDLLPKLAKELHNTFGPEAEAGARGMAGRVNSLKNAFFDLKEELLNGGASSLLTGIFESATRAIKDYRSEIVTATGGSIAQLGKFTSASMEAEAKLTEELIRSKQIRDMNLKSQANNTDELIKSEVALIKNKEAYDELLGAGSAKDFLKQPIEKQLKLSQSVADSVRNLKAQEQAILDAERLAKGGLGGNGGGSGGKKPQIEDKNANKYYEDELKKNILKSEEIQKEANRNKLAIQYEIDQMLIGAQEESLNRDIELARIKFQEKSDVLLNEKAVSGEYMNALTEQLEAEENSIKTKWAEEDRKLKEKQFAEDKARADDEARILYDKRMMHLSTANTIIGTMKLLSGTGKKYALLNKGLAMADIVVNTGRAVMQALTSPPGPPWTTGLAVATGAMGAVQFGKVAGAKFASKGADFITNGPQLMVVGENSGGREHVQVTPMSSPNINGPKSVSNNNSFGNINITVQNGGDLISMLESNPDRFNKLLKNGLKRGAFQGVM
jgi:tape measure domain-containing protein